jgi:hypothetical protein
MNRATALCLAAACLFGADSAVRASQIVPMPPVPISYGWGYKFVSSGHRLNFITSGNAFGIIGLPGNGGNSDMHTAATDTTDISTKIWSFSTATAAHPQTVSDLPFAINIKLTDKASGLSEYVSFGGALNGNFWNNGSTLSPTFFGPLSKSVDINHHLFTVSFESFTPPAGLGHPGEFVFDVSVHHNPEPSTLVLAGIGAPLFGLILRRRRRMARTL